MPRDVASYLNLFKSGIRQELFGRFHRMESYDKVRAGRSWDGDRGSLRVGEALTKDKKSKAACLLSSFGMVE